MKKKSPPPPSSPPSRPSDRDDEEGSASTGAALVRDSGSDSNKNHAKAYLFRYETMARQQEAEDMATIAHLNPCICRLMELLGMEVNADDITETFLCAEVSFEQLRLAFDILQQQQPREAMTTDRQLMMVLNILTQKVDLKHPEQNASTPFVTWAEIVQCYKICVSGMFTLQHLQKHRTHRARARDRTLAMLSLFEPPSTQLFHEDALSVRSSSTAMAALEEPLYLPRLKKKRRAYRKKSTSSRTAVTTVSKGIGFCLAAACVWNLSGHGNNSASSITSKYIAMTQQGLPNPTMLTKQRTVTQYLISAASSKAKELSRQNKTAEAAKNESSTLDEEQPLKTNETDSPISPPITKPTAPLSALLMGSSSATAWLPHEPISMAIGNLFTHLVTMSRRRSQQSTN
jgi:hypothetical protein